LTWGECGTGGGASAFSDLTDVSLTSSSTGDIYYNDGGLIKNLGVGTDGQVLTSNGTIPGWEDATSTGGGTFHYEEATSTASQTVFDISGFTYSVGENQLDVYVNGVYQIIGDSYEETDNNTVTFNSGLNAGDRVVFAVRGGATAGEGSLTEEEVEDYVGGMLGGTETLITVTYQDGTNDIDFVVNDDLSLYDNTTSGFVTEDTNTTYSAGGTLLDLTDTTFSLNEGTLTNTALCTYTDASGLVCDTTDNSSNWDTAYFWGDHAGLYDVLGQATSTLSSHTTSYDHDNYDTAYGWGDHSAQNYLDDDTADDVDALDIDWAGMTDLGESGAVTWGNLGAGELANNSIIDADIDDDGNFTFTGNWDFSGGDIELNNDSVDDADINWGGLTDLNAGGEVAWGNLASGELSSEVLLLGTDVKAGTLTDTKLCTWDSGNSQIVCDSDDTDTNLTDEEVQDKAGAMWTSNTETRASVTYQDGDGTIDIVVDDMNDDQPDNDSEVPDDITVDTTNGATTSLMTITDGTNGIRITPGTDGSTSTIEAF